MEANLRDMAGTKGDTVKKTLAVVICKHLFIVQLLHEEHVVMAPFTNY